MENLVGQYNNNVSGPFSISPNKTITHRSLAKIFYLFVSLHVLLWTIFPALIRKNLPLDVIEGIAWGSQWQWGYYKHPFVAPWLTEIGALLSPDTGWVIYLISQLTIGIAFIAIWRLALKISSPLRAFFSVLLLEGIFYYTFTSTEFNPNIAMIGTWSLAYLFFYNALKKQRLIDWILTGLICGVAVVSKYYSGALLLSMLVLMLCNQAARQSFTNWALYVGWIIFLFVISPNMIWLYDHHFISITYAFNRAEIHHTLLGHFTETFNFLKGQVVNILVAIVIFFGVVYPKNKFEDVFQNSFDRQFINFLLWGPIFITLLFPLLTGDKLRDMWGTPLYSLLGIFLLNSISSEFLEERINLFQMAIYGVMALLLFVYSFSIIIAPIYKHHGSREYFPGSTLAKEVTALWQSNYNQPLKYVIGSTWYSGNVGFYSSQKPNVFLQGSLVESPWINLHELKQAGAIVIWPQQNDQCQIPANYQREFPNIRCESVLTIPYQKTAKKYAIMVGVGIIPPRS